MKKIEIKEKPKARVVKETPPIEEAFDVSKLELIEEKEIIDKYKEFYEQHKQHVMNIAISRVALDSVLRNVEASLTQHMGSPIQLHDEEATSKLDDAFTKSLVVYALDHVLSEFITDQEHRNEYIQQFTAQRPVVSKAPNKQAPIGVSTSNNDLNSAVSKIEQIIKQQSGIQDEAPSPYGFTTPREKNKDNRKVPAAKVSARRKNKR